ncbi:uncharacterized protein [Neodiprion pinetum]|uniref:Uncharacterized protein LOC107218098 isoform X2 n=1 Tax=Neodiprion lecontei TaxID=441921 RepID=A0ABM3FF97_NEOLC|nr:uncharacterized protein LOC124175101 isoform X1 [Neodiprion fabricii]XP_046466521.1 uncharacterized protein LOC124211478 isoform X1 [Neodiprion pinetum]XP_046586672.1 uncharacterized protein LOC107218098 isoform X2 [Neodiprion lecontei]XP_046604349.1 uncharacterized protein LOC124297405 [Neodiprion virginianus]
MIMTVKFLLMVVGLAGNRCYGAPASVTDAVLLGEIDIMTDDEVEISTEEPVPKKCYFGGTTYTHSQTIPTSDPCSHCLCVAGEVYCWWQDCLLHSEPEDFENFDGSLKSTEIPGAFLSVNSSLGTAATLEADDNETMTTESSELAAQIIEEEGYMDVNSTYQDFGTQSTLPTTCVVMGVEYKEGEALPHSTGNCVQCGCGAAGRVECSPQDCVPLLQPPSGAGVDLSRGMDEIF